MPCSVESLGLAARCAPESGPRRGRDRFFQDIERFHDPRVRRRVANLDRRVSAFFKPSEE